MVWDIKWERAACRDQDPELFFSVAEPHTEIGRRQRDEAKIVCSQCPLRDDCLEWALVKGLDDGVWGGYDEDERRKLRQRSLPSSSEEQAA